MYSSSVLIRISHGVQTKFGNLQSQRKKTYLRRTLWHLLADILNFEYFLVVFFSIKDKVSTFIFSNRNYMLNNVTNIWKKHDRNKPQVPELCSLVTVMKSGCCNQQRFTFSIFKAQSVVVQNNSTSSKIFDNY